MIRLRSLYRPG